MEFSPRELDRARSDKTVTPLWGEQIVETGLLCRCKSDTSGTSSQNSVSDLFRADEGCWASIFTTPTSSLPIAFSLTRESVFATQESSLSEENPLLGLRDKQDVPLVKHCPLLWVTRTLCESEELFSAARWATPLGVLQVEMSLSICMVECSLWTAECKLM